MYWRRLQRVVCDNFCKLLQRQTYTFLSSKHGMLLCFATLLFGFVSVVQFGEIALEWSILRYQKTLFPYVDNILHKSFQDRLCLPLPIDVVYTWVNGTDPQLLKQLAKLKNEMEERFNDSISLKDNTNMQQSATRSNYSQVGMEKMLGEACPYENCVALNTLVLKVRSLVKITDLKKIDPVFQQASLVYNVSVKSNSESDSKYARLTVVEFPDENSLKRAVDRPFHINGEKVVAQQAYLTSQSIELAVRMRAMALVSDHVRRSNYDNGDAFKRFLKNHFATKLKVLDYYKKEKVAVLTFKDDQSYQNAIRLKKGDIKFKGISLTFSPVLMVWEPFSNVDPENYDNHFSASRFADNEELRYSLRSVEKFAPWVRQIFIVTNGQIPSWLNLDNPRIKIVTHAEIFANKSHLPTFSSPAIESHLHKIAGLSNKFIYLNDDVMFGDEVWPDDFYTHAKGQKVFLSWPVPNCNDGCPATWINDKYCDKACNVSECDWDGGDCLNPKTRLPHKWQSVISSIEKKKPHDFCNAGCADSWIGDRYCDGSCNNPACGFDGGDCGNKHLSELHSEILHEDSDVFQLPSGLKAMVFNLSGIYGEGKILEGDQDGASILRSVTIAQKFKMMIVTFYPNETMTTASFRLSGFKKTNDTKLTEVKFNVTIETISKFKKIVENTGDALASQLKISESTLRATLYPLRIYSASAKVEFWNMKDGKVSLPVWPTVDSSEYCVPKIPSNVKVPEDILQKFMELEEDLKIGDITQKGHDRKKSKLIKEKLGIVCFREEMLYMKSLTKHDVVPSHQITTSSPNRNIKAAVSPSHFSSRHLTKYDEDVMDNVGFLPWERQQVFKRIQERKEQKIVEESYRTTPFYQRRLLDAFSGSLLHVNRIYNRAFGYKARKVPSHMPHMIDVAVMEELQAKFSDEFDVTSLNKLRSKNDMQFSLSYFYYIIDQTKEFNVSQFFQEVDVDKSGSLSDRELRILMSKFSTVPLTSDAIHTFLEQLRNCSHILDNSTNVVRHPSERQYGYDLPPVTERLLRNCEVILKQLNNSNTKESKFKHEIVGEDDVAFKMIKNNVTHVLLQLDQLRKSKKKFVCLNDNIEHDKPNASVVKGLLVDFYESLFPTPSQFELPRNSRNKFLNVDELNLWKNEKRRLDSISDGILIVSLIVILFFVCKCPIMYVIRRCGAVLRRCMRTPRMITSSTSTRLLTV